MGKVTIPKGFDPTPIRHWFLVANRSEARVYDGLPGKGFRFLKKLTNPKARMADAELLSDKPGKSFSSARGSGISHGFAPHSDHHEVVAQDFARKVCRALRKDVLSGEVTRLTLVAEPHFLGLLNGFLSPQTKAILADSVPHDWQKWSDKELEKYLKKKIA